MLERLHAGGQFEKQCSPAWRDNLVVRLASAPSQVEIWTIHPINIPGFLYSVGRLDLDALAHLHLHTLK
jgi:hypothetical protein